MIDFISSQVRQGSAALVGFELPAHFFKKNLPDISIQGSFK